MVKSSSLDKLFVSMTLGLIHTGGTTKWSMIRLLTEVYPPTLTKINCFKGILERMCLAYHGFNSTGNYWLWVRSADSITPRFMLL